MQEHEFEVRTIIGVPSTRDSNKAHKGYARQATIPHQVNVMNHWAKIPWLFKEPITFTKDEAQGLIHPHKDAVVVSLKIAGQKVHRVLINNGSSVNVLFISTLDHLNLVGHTVTIVHTPLYGFSKKSVHTEGELNLLVKLRDAPCQHI